MRKVTSEARLGAHAGRAKAPDPRPVPLRMLVGHAVRRFRAAAGYTSQEAYADAAGVHRTYVGKVERGELNLSIDTLERLARALGVSAGELLLAAERDARDSKPADGTPTPRL